MKSTNTRYRILFSSAAILAGAMVVAGCNRASHPDEKSAVNDALKNSNLSSVSVSQDRDKGVMTLKGNLDSQDLKNQAENIARQAAPDYTVADEIGVRPPGASEAGSVASNLDSAIEDNFKAMIKAHANLNDQSISGARQKWHAGAEGIGQDGEAEEGSRRSGQKGSKCAASGQRTRGQAGQALDLKLVGRYIPRDSPEKG